VAVYCNDPAGEAAYVTSVSVVHDHQGLGVASRLLAQSIDLARQHGFARLSLEADRGNGAALEMYARAGFIVTSERDRMVHMDLEMREHGHAGGQA
jgi:ribosomal protein S18 acetylase RimI-like enzyme